MDTDAIRVGQVELILGVGYKADIDTSVGTISINPSLRYSPVNKYTEKVKASRNTTETNELRAGVKVGLTVK